LSYTTLRLEVCKILLNIIVVVTLLIRVFNITVLLPRISNIKSFSANRPAVRWFIEVYIKKKLLSIKQ